MHLFCFGLGYSAGVLARRIAAGGATISGTSTRSSGVARIKAFGFRGVLFDGIRPGPDVREALTGVTHVLLSIPPDAQGDPALRHHAADLASSSDLKWIGYFSTVGVYGDAAGQWVSEETGAKPASERGKRRLEAECRWLDFGRQTGKCVMIFRLPGIYGPGRSALDDLRSGTARRIVKPGQVFNRIHVADIATAVEAGMQHSRPGGIYNVTDDEPAPPQDVVAYAAKLLGLPVPPDLDFGTANLTPMTRSFYSESKRVSNSRMKEDLGVRLAYPTYRHGLQGLLDHGG